MKAATSPSLLKAKQRLQRLLREVDPGRARRTLERVAAPLDEVIQKAILWSERETPIGHLGYSGKFIAIDFLDNHARQVVIESRRSDINIDCVLRSFLIAIDVFRFEAEKSSGGHIDFKYRPDLKDDKLFRAIMELDVSVWPYLLEVQKAGAFLCCAIVYESVHVPSYVRLFIDWHKHGYDHPGVHEFLQYSYILARLCDTSPEKETLKTINQYELGSYTRLFQCIDNSEQLAVVIDELCDAHIQKCSAIQADIHGNFSHEVNVYDAFGQRFMMLWPLDILAFLKLRERLGYPRLSITHPLLDPWLGENGTAVVSTPCQEPLIEKLQRSVAEIIKLNKLS